MDTKKEEWRDIKGYEGDYQVSSHGRVKSLKFNKETLLKQKENKHGYLLVCLSYKGNRKTSNVHSLVASAFINQKPDGNKMVIDHIDNNQLNNKVANLQIVTNRENSSKDRRRKLPLGVYINRCGNYYSKIHISGNSIYLGTFPTLKEASNAYQKQLNKIKS
jgi:hypothetical protein